jgi:hypothetical protein
MRSIRKLLYLFRGIIRGTKSKELKFMLGQSAISSSRASANSFHRLWDSEVKIYSQFGEDGIIDYICQKLSLSKPRILEIGAGNFSECNSRWLVESRNSGAYLVDGRRDLPAGVMESQLLWQSHLFFDQAWVTPENIQVIFDKASKAIEGIDIFSLDLDGNDYWILKELNLKSTSIVVVEYNPLFGPKLSVTIPRNDTFLRSQGHTSWLYYGASLKAFIDLLEIKGFSFLGTNRVGNNAFFIQKRFSECFNLLPHGDLSIFTDWPIRDSRSKTGELDYLSGNDRIVAMREMPLLDLYTSNMIKVADVLH